MNRIITEPVVLRFIGFCGKKNRKAPNRNGRGMHIEPRTRAMLNSMAMQIPREYRDIFLENPSVEWDFTYTNSRVDTDNIISTVLDLLVQYHVLAGDSIKHFGGRQVINPPVRGDVDSVTVTLTPNPEPPPAPPSPRYRDVRRERRLARLQPSTAVLPVIEDEMSDEWPEVLL